MSRIIKILLLFIAIVLISACGEAERKILVCDVTTNQADDCQTDEKANPNVSNWRVKSNIVFANCDVIVNRETIYSMKISRSEERAIITTPFSLFQAAYRQEKLVWSGQFFDDINKKFFNYINLNIAIDDEELFGEGSLEVSDTIEGELICLGKVTLSATRIDDIDQAIVSPTLLAVAESDITDQSILLRWIDRSINENLFVIERSLNENDDFQIIATLAKNTITFNDNALSEGTKYCYRVKATNAIGDSAYTMELCVQTDSAPVLLPAVPVDFSASTSESQLSISLTWIDVENTLTYEIQRSEIVANVFETIATLSADIGAYTDTLGLNKETQYWYRIRAVNSAGASDYSNAIGYSEFTPAIEIRSGNIAKISGSLFIKSGLLGDNVRIIWQNASNVSHLRLERSLLPTADFVTIENFIPIKNKTLFDTTDLIAGETYYYRLYAVNEIGESYISGNVLLEKTKISSEAPFTYGGWRVDNGVISILNSDTSICTVENYDCLVQQTDNGFIKLQIGDFINKPNEIIYMTIFTDKNATGDMNTLNYYHINTTKKLRELGSDNPLNPLITHSVRKGSPTPALSAAHSGEAELYQIRLTGKMIHEYDVATDKSKENPEPSLFFITLNYDVNAIPRFEREGFTGPAYVYNGLLPAITSVQIRYGEQVWRSNRGYVNGQSTAYPVTTPDINGDEIIQRVDIDNYYFTVYGNDQYESDSNADKLFGLDIFNFSYFLGLAEDRDPLQGGHNISNFPTDFLTTSYGFSLYLNQGNKILTGAISDFNFIAIEAPAISPTALSIDSKTDSSIGFSWAGTANEAHEVIIERNETGQTGFTVIAVEMAGEKTFSDVSLSADTYYCYRIKFSYSTVQSDFSNTRCASTNPTSYAPIDLTFEITSNGQAINFSWISSTEITGYRIEHSLSENGPFVDVSGLLSGETSEFSVQNLAPITHYYRIYATSEFGENYIEKNINPIGPPDQPMNFNLSATQAPDKVTLTWDKVDNALYYRIERSFESDRNFYYVTNTALNTTTSFVDTDILRSKLTYFYRLYAVNGVGERLVQEKIQIPYELNAVDLSLDYLAWTVTNGYIVLDKMLCDTTDYSCLGLTSDRGIVKFLVFSKDFLALSFLGGDFFVVTIYTNVEANGVPEELDYYHVNVSQAYSDGIYLFGPDARLPINNVIFSKRKGLPTPLPKVNNTVNPLKFVGEVSGMFVGEYDVQTNQLNPYLTPEPFLINIEYDANTANRFYYGGKRSSEDRTVFSELHTAISSIEITSEGNVWHTNLGLINSYQDLRSFDFSDETEFRLLTSQRFYYLTAYANPELVSLDNNVDFFGVDFTGLNILVEIKDTPIPPYPEYQLSSPFSFAEFQQTGVSVYLDGGNRHKIGRVSNYTIKPASQLSNELPNSPVLLGVFSESESTVNLKWADISSNETEFIVERSDYITGINSEIALLPMDSEEYLDELLDSNTRYCYRLKSINSAGASAYSEQLCAITENQAVIPVSAPEVPSNYNVGEIDTDLSNYVTWTISSYSETEFIEIERSESDVDLFSKIATLSNVAIYFNDKNIMKNTVYRYRIRAINSAGASDYTDIISVTSARDPDVVTGFNATKNTVDLFVSLTWNSPDNAIKLVLQRKENLDDEFKNIVSFDFKLPSSYEDTAVIMGESYSYRLVSVNSLGYSASEIVEIVF